MNTLKESWEGLLRLLNKKSRELNAMKILKSKCCPNLMLRTASKTHLNQQKSCNLLSQPWKNTQNVSKMGDGKFKQGLLLLFKGTHFYCLGKKKHHFFKETNCRGKKIPESRVISLATIDSRDSISKTKYFSMKQKKLNCSTNIVIFISYHFVVQKNAICPV